MELFDLLEDYIIDQDDGLRKLLTWFYNLVMQLETIQQCGAEPTKEVRGEQLNVMGIRNELSRLALEIWFWKNPSSEVVHLNPVFLIIILALN